MISTKTQKMVLAALMAAMTCVSTMIIQIPSPMQGYIHLGDGLVLLSGIIFGPLYGGAAAGIGSMFADILTSYSHYALGTLIIKTLAAMAGGFIFHKFSHKQRTAIVLAGIVSGTIVTSGYFFYASLILGNGLSAAASVSGNLLQNVLGLIVAFLLMPVLTTSPVIKDFITKKV